MKNEYILKKKMNASSFSIEYKFRLKILKMTDIYQNTAEYNTKL